MNVSKKSYFGIFSNFAFYKIKNLDAPKSLILGFSTVSLETFTFCSLLKVHITGSMWIPIVKHFVDMLSMNRPPLKLPVL